MAPRRYIRYLVPLLVALSAFAPGVTRAAYVITDLAFNASGTTSTTAIALNNSGAVIGVRSDFMSGTSTYFLYESGSFHSLDFLNGLATGLRSINDSGQILGFTSTGSFIATDGGITHALSGFLGIGLNSSGVVSGQFGNYPFGAVWSPASSAFSLLPADVRSAWAINDFDQITGAALFQGRSFSTAFLYNNGSLEDIGTLAGGTYSLGRAINSSGDIVGQAGLVAGGDRAFLFQDGTMFSLGVISGDQYSVANDINDLGQIVGTSGIFAGMTRGFLYQEGAMLDLNSLPELSGWKVSDAIAINNQGQIIVTASRPGSFTTSLLLTPRSVPEPPILTLVLLLPFMMRWLSLRSSAKLSTSNETPSLGVPP